jgi:hypothetical protein
VDRAFPQGRVDGPFASPRLRTAKRADEAAPVSGERDTRDREHGPSRDTEGAESSSENPADDVRSSPFRRAQYVRWRARKAAGKATNPSAAIPNTTGAPLPDDARRRMEPKLRADLSGSGVFKSTGSGASWSAASGGISSFTRSLAIAPSSPSTIYAAIGGSSVIVYVTNDGGVTWSSTGRALSLRSLLQRMGHA